MLSRFHAIQYGTVRYDTVIKCRYKCKSPCRMTEHNIANGGREEGKERNAPVRFVERIYERHTCMHNSLRKNNDFFLQRR